MSSVPAVIAKASAIHNPIIYAITHPKYRCGLLQASKPTSGMEGLSLQRKAEVICLPLISCMCISWGVTSVLVQPATLGRVCSWHAPSSFPYPTREEASPNYRAMS